MKVSRVLAPLAALLLVLAACSGDSEPTETFGDVATTTAAPSETTVATTEAGGHDYLEDVRGAIVRIVAEGSFADPEFGQQYNAAGSGSGFFISEDGLAVTNNHVVTGAAFLQVYVDGDEEPRNARVLGVSECSDLAVIDVDGDGYSYLEWYEGDLVAGTPIFAAGFPLGDEEYTLLDGITEALKTGDKVEPTPPPATRAGRSSARTAESLPSITQATEPARRLPSGVMRLSRYCRV